MGTKATREELGDLGVVYARLFEFVKDGKRPARAVIAGLQLLADGQSPEYTGFDHHNHLLLFLDDQLERLRHYNREYWDNRLTDEQLAAVDTFGDSTPRVDDLTIFHVQFDSLEETVEMWWKVFVGEQPKHFRMDGLKFDPKHLRLITANIRLYEPGIHRIKLDLVAHWEPKNGRSVTRVREGAKGTGEILAQLEVFSAYGLHSELFRMQDGVSLPYSCMPGTELTVPGYSEPRILHLNWMPSTGRAQLSATWASDYHNHWAAPVVKE